MTANHSYKEKVWLITLWSIWLLENIGFIFCCFFRLKRNTERDETFRAKLNFLYFIWFGLHFCSYTLLFYFIYSLRSSMSYGQWAQRAIAEAKQRWSVIGWVTQIWLFWAPPCFRRHAKPLVPAAFAVVSTYQSALGRVPVFLWVIHKEGLCTSNGDINRLKLCHHTLIKIGQKCCNKLVNKELVKKYVKILRATK
jgi:hypothetical protein